MKHLRGFTLVELLVVITIIGIIMAMALPAMNAARGSARILQCKNHLAQLGKGCFTHASEQLTLPTGGWGWQFAGNPTKGFRELQPGGWLYNILPFIDNQALHDMPGDKRMSTPVPLFHCPSKRQAITYPLEKDEVMRSSSGGSSDKSVIARNDYAANGGTRADADVAGESNSYAGGLKKFYDAPNAKAMVGVRNFFKTKPNNVNDSTGTCCPGSGISLQSVSDADGSTNTIMLGERHIDPDQYFSGTATDDAQGWDQGYGCDTVRWGGADCKLLGMTLNTTDYSESVISKAKEYFTRQNMSKNHWIPIQDKAGYTSPARWGSPHADVCNFCMADSSVRSISYGVDPFVFWCLCNSKDGQSIPSDVLK